MRYIILIALSFLSIIPVHATGKKQAPISITFHMEASGADGNKFSIPIDTPRGRRFIQRVPSIATGDIAAFRPFPSPHNEALYGMVIQLNQEGAKRLRAFTGQNIGTWMVASINGRVVDMMLIDKQIDGRVITIWRGLTPEILQLCDQHFPRIGEDPKQWKERLKNAKKAQKR